MSRFPTSPGPTYQPSIRALAPCQITLGIGWFPWPAPYVLRYYAPMTASRRNSDPAQVAVQARAVEASVPWPDGQAFMQEVQVHLLRKSAEVEHSSSILLEVPWRMPRHAPDMKLRLSKQDLVLLSPTSFSGVGMTNTFPLPESPTFCLCRSGTFTCHWLRSLKFVSVISRA